MRLPLVVSLWLIGTVAAVAQYPDLSPPPGIEIPRQEREELVAESGKLQADIDALAGSGTLSAELRQRLPDVEIFCKAVSWSLELDEIYDLKEIGFARKVLAEGRKRLESLQVGTAPWTTATGPVVRGFRSRIDGSVQPYGVIVPKERPTSGGRLDIFLHGRNDKYTELAFVHERMVYPALIRPEGGIVLRPYGRFCNAFKFAGEVDVLEALDDAMKHYQISPEHVSVRGFSMGGAGSWHLGGHHTTRWAAIAPGAGFVETANYAKVFAPGKVPPTEWERILWRLYDVPGYAVNLTNRPVIVFSGEKDPQKKAADVMEAAIKAVGGEMRHLIAPNTGHGYDRETKAVYDKIVDEAVVQGRPHDPARVRFATYTLRYNALDWIEVAALDKHWDEATVDAIRPAPGVLEVHTKNVAGLTLRPESAGDFGVWKATIDGDAVECLAAADGLHFHKVDGHWAAGAVAAGGLRKRHGLQGPIDDAFLESFTFVRPTGEFANPAVKQWVESELERARTTWRLTFRGVARVIDDTAVTPEIARTTNLVLWGDPRSNAVLAKILPQLPLEWDAETVSIAGRSYDAKTHAPVMIHPNPLAPDRYVVLNSSYTFRRGSGQTNALMTPKLPDWAVIDLTTPPSLDGPGRLAAAGFCDERWQVPVSP